MAANPQMLIRIATTLDQLKKNLAEGKAQIEITTAGMQKLAGSLDGSKLEQRAHNITAAIHSVGGATKLTDAEAIRHLKTLDAWIAKGERMGKEIPPDILKTRDALKAVDDAANKGAGSGSNLLGTLTKIGGAMGIAFSIGAVKNFIGSVFDAAANIHDVASKLGLSTDAMQGFKFAAEQGGSSLDAVGTAITKMNIHLADGDKSAVKSLRQLGLDFQSIRSMKPEDAFLAITDAIKKIPDPIDQSNLAVKLFGKSASELLPAIKEGFRETADGADKMSKDTIESLEKAGDAWEKLWNKVIIVSGGMLAEMMKNRAFTAKFIDDERKFGTAIAKQLYDQQADIEKRTTEHAGKIYGAFKPSPPPALHQTAEQLAAIEAAAKKAAAAAEKYAQVVADIFAASVPLTLQQKEQIVSMDKLGISTGKMADFLKIGEEPIKKYNDALKEQAKAIADIGKQIDKIPHNVKLRLETTSLAGATPMIDVATVKKASESYGAIRKIADATYGDIEGRMKAMGVNTSAELGRLAVVARERFESMRDSGKFSADALAAAWKNAQDATDKAIGKTSGLFGSLMSDLGKIPGMLIASFQGGGGGAGAAKAVGSMLGSTLGSHLSESLVKNGGKLFQGALGKVFGEALPVIGSLIGPLAGAIWNKLFGTAGRDAVKDFAATFKGGFDGKDGLHEALNTLGAEGERLWIKLTQGTGRNNPAQAKATIDEITAALSRQKDATAAAAQAVVDNAAVHQAELDGISAKYDDIIGKLKGELGSFASQLQAEADAPEFDEIGNRIYGVLETKQMALKAQLDAEIAAAEESKVAALAAKEEEFAGMLEAGQKVDAELRIIFGKTLEIPYAFVPSGSAGGYGTAPSGAPSSRGETSRASGGQSGEIVIQNHLTMPNGEVLIREVVRTGKRLGIM